MGFLELLLGWAIVVLLGIGSIAAAEPFWGRPAARPRARVIALAEERPARATADDRGAREAA